MELGLSLGHASKVSEKEEHQKINGGGLMNFCRGLGLNSHSEMEKTQKISPEMEDDEDDDRINISAQDSENNNNKEKNQEESPVQLDLLPLVPVLRRISSDNGSWENCSSGNGKAAAAAEEASSANSVGSQFRLDFGVYGGSKRGLEGRGNDVVEGFGSDDDEEEEEENGVSTRKKLRLSKDQSAFLEDTFKEHHTLNPKQKLALAKQLNLRPRQVEVWFQNRRARTKLKQTEVDCEYLKRCCETLTDENRRLQKELQELRALKISNPFYMQSPPTTLTMCPSCERVATTTAAAPPLSAASGNGKVGKTDHTVMKPIPFPLNKPIFFPFSQNSTYPNQPAAS